MATTFVEYTGDGQASKQFTFPSYQESDVKVRVDGVLKTTSTHYNITSYTTTGGGNVVFTSGNIPSSPAKIRIYRDTSVDVAKATYTAGSSVKAADLNNNNTQLLYRAQEEQVPNLIQSYDVAASAIETSNIKDANVTTDKIADSNVTTAKIADSNVTTAKIADNAVTMAKLNSGALPTDITVASANIVDGTIVEADLSNSAITANKIANNAVTSTEILNGAVTTAKLATDAVDGTKLADNAVDSEHYTDGSIDRVHLEADIIDSTKLADNAVNSEHYVDGSIDRVHLAADIVDDTKLADNAVGSEHIQANAVTDSEIATGTLDNRYFTETELTNGALDGRYFTETESDARYFNISSGETIKDGDTFPDNDTTIATTAAINDRIIDLVDDVGGFDIIQSEHHFPNTNPQGTTGQSAVISVKAAAANLVPSGTTVTIVNGNLANNANVTITGVPSTIPVGFGFLVESTSTTHTYSFHRLVPKATEVTTVAGNITNINAVANNETNINAAVSNASNINAAVSNASNITAVAGNASNINAAVSNASNINSAVSNASNITTTASNITNVNNVGNNVTNVNSVSNSAGANQTFTVTVQNVSGNKYFIDGVQTPVLKLARGKTYTFDMSDSSNSGHPLAFRDSSDNSYTTGVTTSGTAGSSGATVVIVVAANAPSSLKYYCTSHGNAMGNTITVIDDNIGTVAGSISNVNTVGGAIANVNTTAGSISNVNTVASNINSVNNFFSVYRTGANNPTTSLDTGDLFFNTTSNSLKVYTGSAWVDGVTATGDFAVTTGNTFTGSNRYNDNVKAEFGTGADLEISHDGANSRIKNNSYALFLEGGSTPNMSIYLRPTAGEDGIKVTGNGAAELYYDNSKKFETISSGATVTGSLGIGTTSPLNTLHSHGDGIIRISPSAGANQFESGRVRFTENTSDLQGAYIHYNGLTNKLNIGTHAANDNLVSNDLKAISIARGTGNVQLPNDNGKLQLGASQDLEIYHNGTNNAISTNNGEIQIIKGTSENIAKFIPDGAVELYHDSSKRLETTSAGATVTGDLTSSGVLKTTGNVLTVEGATPRLNLIDTNNNSDFEIGNTNGTLNIADSTNGANRFRVFSNGTVAVTGNLDAEGGLDVTGNITVTGTVDGVDIAALNTTVGNITTDVVSDTSPQLGGDLDCNGREILLDDSNAIKIGNGSDLRLIHDGTNSEIKNYTGTFYLFGDSVFIGSSAAGEPYFKGFADGAAELYHNSQKKLETTSWGTSITGTLVASSNIKTGSDTGKLMAGAGDDLEIFHDGSVSRINNATGDLSIYNTGDDISITAADDIQLNVQSTEAAVKCIGNGQVELYYDNAKKFETTSNGAKISGTTAAFLEITTTSGSHNPMFRGSNGDRTFDTGLRGDSGDAWCVYDVTASDNRFMIDTSGNVSIPNDNAKLKIGAGDDIQIFHDGSESYVKNTNSNSNLILEGAHGVDIKHGGEDMAKFKPDAAVELFYDNAKKFETTSTGATLSGNLTCSHVFLNLHHGLYFSSSAGYSPRINNDDGSTGQQMQFYTNNGLRFVLQNDGHLRPGSNDSFDLGTSSYRWRNIYTNDLNLSNEGSSNDVDGSWGDWTIQEGESDLFLKNNRSGKKYKFNLTEVS